MTVRLETSRAIRSPNRASDTQTIATTIPIPHFAAGDTPVRPVLSSFGDGCGAERTGLTGAGLTEAGGGGGLWKPGSGGTGGAFVAARGTGTEVAGECAGKASKSELVGRSPRMGDSSTWFRCISIGQSAHHSHRDSSRFVAGFRMAGRISPGARTADGNH